LTTSHDGKGDQERHDANGTNDVRHHGKRTGDITRIRPDNADNHSHHKESDHSNEPVEDSFFGDATDPRSIGAFRQPFRQTLSYVPTPVAEDVAVIEIPPRAFCLSVTLTWSV